LRALADAGVRVTLNSDDPPFFHTSLAREYDLASRVMGFTDEALLTMTRTAIEAAFVDEATRQRLLSAL
jgi:adenosine deaminase